MIGVDIYKLVASIEKLLETKDVKILKFTKEYTKFTIVLHTIENYPREYKFEYITDFSLFRVKDGQNNIEVYVGENNQVMLKKRIVNIFKDIGNVSIESIK